MDKFIFPAVLILLLSWVLQPVEADAQNRYDPQLNVFLDCTRCFDDYIKETINFVNFVRDKEDAQVHLLVTRARTGSGGREFSLKFLGRSSYKARKDTLEYTSAGTDTDDEVRTNLARYVRIGLLPFIAQTSMVNQVDVSVSGDREPDQRNRTDKWNNWIFEIDLNTSFDGEERQNSIELWSGLEASRITKKWKIEADLNYNYERDHFEFSDQPDVTSTETRQFFDALVVKSLSPHWSAGLAARASSSSFSNTEVELGGSPAVEYNVFPYRQYTRRELTFQYRLTPTYFSYRDTTIFNKTEEFLFEQQLAANYEITETWGELEISLSGSNFLHDFSKNRLEVESNLEFRIFRGLSLEIRGEYSLINDQISLPQEDLSDEEVLLRRRELATAYSFRGSIGLSYSFGSIYNDIVNPRFD